MQSIEKKDVIKTFKPGDKYMLTAKSINYLDTKEVKDRCFLIRLKRDDGFTAILPNVPRDVYMEFFVSYVSKRQTDEWISLEHNKISFTTKKVTYKKTVDYLMYK